MPRYIDVTEYIKKLLEEKYQQCEHPNQTAVEADAYMSPPEKMCELYYPNTTKPPPGGDG